MLQLIAQIMFYYSAFYVMYTSLQSMNNFHAVALNMTVDFIKMLS